MSSSDEGTDSMSGFSGLPTDMDVIDISDEKMPKTDIDVLIVRVSVDNHIFSITFKEISNNEFELFTDPLVGDIDEPSKLQMATTIAVEHLRNVKGYQIMLESTDEQTANTGPFNVYFYGGWHTSHVFKNNDAKSVCEKATVTAGRQSLDDIDGSISDIDGICPKCMRRMKLAGHFESYEHPEGGL